MRKLISEMQMRISLVAFVTTALLASNASAAAFFLNDHGAGAGGRANAVAATVDDGSAIFHNPAGVAASDGYSFYGGVNFILPSAFYEGEGVKVETDTGLAYTPNAYFMAEITDLVHAGFGFYTPFGLRISWPATSPGRDIIREQALATYFMSPVLALNLSQWVKGLSLGGGVDLVPSSVTLKRDILFGDDVGTTDVGASAFGVGGRVGLQYRPIKSVSIGVAFRSAIKLDFEGDGDLDMAAPYRAQLPPDGPISTALTLPPSMVFGIAYRPIPELEIEVDGNWVGWSTYDELAIELPGDVTSISAKKYRDTAVVRAAVEYSFNKMGLDVRAGYTWDQTPIPHKTLDFTLPDGDRQQLAVGATYKLPAGMWLDLAVAYVLPTEQDTGDIPFQPLHKGTFGLSAFVTGINFGIQIGGNDSQECCSQEACNCPNADHHSTKPEPPPIELGPDEAPPPEA